MTAATREPEGLRLERLARMAEADNWLHGFEPRRRSRRHLLALAGAAAIALGLVVLRITL